MDLDQKIALVTGGSRGIGRSIALELAKAGATVWITCQQSQEKGLAVLKELQSISKKSHGMVQFDVASHEGTAEGIKRVVDAVGTIDILVNNAGITRDNLLLRMKEAEWDDVMATNLKGVFNCSKVVSKLMLKKRAGTIINISSVAGQMGNPGQTNYAASKAGMIGFTKSLAKELASRNIRVNAIAPGFIETEMTGSMQDSLKADICKGIALGRFGTCEDIAHLVVFLASRRASYITGQVIGINGGLYT